MHKILILVISCFILTGCSLLPKITFNKTEAVPQQIVKNNSKISCQGEYKTNDNGDVIYCSKGYYNQANDSVIKERRYTFAETIANFIRGLVGWSFWIVVFAIIFVPGLAGWLIGNIFNNSKKVAETLIRGIQLFKKNGSNLTGEAKTQYQQAIETLLISLEQAHSNDPAVIKEIDNIRTNLKIKEGL